MFIPLRAVTTAAPPRMSMAVTMTAKERRRSERFAARRQLRRRGGMVANSRMVMRTKVM